VASARRIWLLLGALTLGGAALRLPFLGLQSLWYDESFTLAVVQQHTLGTMWDQVRLSESTPPLYYAITWGWERVVGDGDASLRAPAAIAGVLCVPAAYLAVRRAVGERAALGAAALTAASPVMVSYSLNARAYSLLALLGCLSLWALGEALARRATPWLAAWALLSAACLWTHYYAVFLVAAEFGVLLWRLPGRRAWVGAAGAAVAVSFLPLLSLIADQHDERASHIEFLHLGERVRQAVRQLAAGPNPPSSVLEAAAVAIAAAALAGGLYLALRRRRQEVEGDSSPAPLALIAACALLTPLVLALTGVDDHFFMRNLLVAWGALAGLGGLALVRVRAIPLGLAVAVGVALTIATHAGWRHQNADWSGALARLGPGAERVPVAILPGFDAPVADTYMGRNYTARPLLTRAAWVVVEPGRRGRAELTEASGYPQRLPDGFRPTVVRTYRGFRMILVEATVPALLTPAGFGPDQLGGPPIVLAPSR
jgi:4-amino-4-deoxy-L-arabinose transferase-like glycosyltransferase